MTQKYRGPRKQLKLYVQCKENLPYQVELRKQSEIERNVLLNHVDGTHTSLRFATVQ